MIGKKRASERRDEHNMNNAFNLFLLTKYKQVNYNRKLYTAALHKKMDSGKS